MRESYNIICYDNRCIDLSRGLIPLVRRPSCKSLHGGHLAPCRCFFKIWRVRSKTICFKPFYYKL